MLGYHPTGSQGATWKMPDCPQRDEATQSNDKVYRAEGLKQELDAWKTKKDATHAKTNEELLGFVKVAFDKYSGDYSDRDKYKQELFAIVDLHNNAANEVSNKPQDEKSGQKNAVSVLYENVDQTIEVPLPKQLVHRKQVQLLSPQDKLEAAKIRLLTKLEEGVQRFGSGEFGKVLVYYYHCLNKEDENEMVLKPRSSAPTNLVT